MEEQKVFKTSMFGFDKKTVMDYLYEVDEKAKNTEQELSAKIQDINSANAELGSKIDEVESQYQIVSSKLNAERENSTKAAQLIGELNQEIERQRRQIADKDREVQIQSERCKQLLQRAEEAEKKVSHFDQLSHRVGDLILEAQRSADQIVEKAKTKANVIAQDAEHTAKSAHGELQSIREDIVGIKRTTAELFDAVNRKLESLETLVDSATKRFSEEGGLSAVTATEAVGDLDFSTVAESASQEEPKAPDVDNDKYISYFFRGKGVSEF